MKRVIGLLLVLAALGGIGFYVLKKYLPNLVPPSKNIKQYLPLNSDTQSPFTLPTTKTLSVYFDLKGEMPRVLAFDNKGILFTSLTSSGKVVALIDENGDLVADRKIEVLRDLNRPHGLVFDDRYLYVAESNRVVRYNYDSDTNAATAGKILFNLPNGGRHFTRTIKIINSKLYTSVGSSCDVCVEKNDLRAAILVSNLDGSDLRVLAKGLRNTVFFTVSPTGKIWGTEMGRDFLGDDLPPDEVNIIDPESTAVSDYGWPYCYGNGVKDIKFVGNTTSSCAENVAPAFNLPAHSAPLGITFDNSGNLLVSMHGSWNSSAKVGYKIVKLNIFADSVTGSEDYLTGFLETNGEVLGRPVDLIFDRSDNLFISDDKSGLIYVLAK